jgi:energy-coupling factor transport system substrate-specific component
MAVERAAARSFALPSIAWGTVTFAGLNLLGVLAYLHPFIFASTAQTDSGWFEHNTDAPLIFGAVGALCMLLTVAELTNGSLNTKGLAGLGVLAAFAAVMRTVTLPAGANLYFFLVILGGYAFGVRLGFLLGALSFFLSAIITGGFGPWLPFQMFASAWMGMSAGLLRPVAVRAGIRGRGEVGVLVLFGIAWGLLFGAITNLWSWPFWAGGPDVTYEPGIGAGEALRRYWNFYLLTSLGWDLMRSVCNALVLGLAGGPLLRALLRFRERFSWEPWRQQDAPQ